MEFPKFKTKNNQEANPEWPPLKLQSRPGLKMIFQNHKKTHLLKSKLSGKRTGIGRL